MKLIVFFLILLLTIPAYAQPRGGNPQPRWTEEDGTIRGTSNRYIRPLTIVVSPDVISADSLGTHIMSLDVGITVGDVTHLSRDGNTLRVSDNVHTLIHSVNGTFLETIRGTVDSDGATITYTLSQDDSASPGNVTKDLTMVFSDDFTTLDCTTSPCTATLTAGSATSPQENFVYIPQSTKTLTVATNDFPSGEHIKVANVVVRTAGTVVSEDALVNRNWNDHAQGTDLQGHITHIEERLRQEHAQWKSGVSPTLTIDSGPNPDTVLLSTTSGTVYQMHKQTFVATDMSSGDDINVVNDSTDAYTKITDFNEILVDANGDSMSGKYFNLVVWGVQNKTGEQSHIMVNLPDGFYNTDTNSIATNDDNKTAVFTIPETFRGTGFLIARFTLRHQTASSGTWTLINTDDLRGQVPSIIAGGGTTSTVTIFPDNTFAIFDEADDSKQLMFQNSFIPTGTTVTVTSPVKDGVMALSEDVLLLDGTNAPTDDYSWTTNFKTTGTVSGDTLSVNDKFSLPTADGTAGQVMQTNGEGVLTFVSSTFDIDTIVTFNSDVVVFEGNVVTFQ